MPQAPPKYSALLSRPCQRCHPTTSATKGGPLPCHLFCEPESSWVVLSSELGLGPGPPWPHHLCCHRLPQSEGPRDHGGEARVFTDGPGPCHWGQKLPDASLSRSGEGAWCGAGPPGSLGQCGCRDPASVLAGATVLFIALTLFSEVLPLPGSRTRGRSRGLFQPGAGRAGWGLQKVPAMRAHRRERGSSPAASHIPFLCT